MNGTPFFSVIIPTYNRAGLIGTCIASVTAQLFGDFEIIVVDDGSTDNTADVVKAIADERIRYIRQENGERSKARNTGTKAATGGYITFLDSDDCFYPDHLEKAKEMIVHNRNAEFFHMRYELINPQNGTKRQMPLLTGNLNRELTTSNFMSCNAVFLSKRVAQANLFNESISFMEDWELWLRIAAQHPLVYSPVITSAIIEHDNRSVLQTDKARLISDVSKFLDIVTADKHVTQFYGKDLSKIVSSCFSYIALHIALTGKNRGTAVRYLLKAAVKSPGSIFKRRTLAIFKHLLIP